MSSHLGTDLKRSKYRLLGLVGQGQFGQVFCAVHRQTGRLVALKNLEHQRFPTHKFLRELRFLLSLQHVNIVTCRSLEHTSTGRYLVMDYCEGGTLRNLITEDSGLSLPQSLKLITDVLLGLEHAHDRGIVHCDIKPENILLSLQPVGWTARISDFGIAKLSQELPQEWSNMGSPAYMAPEQFYGQYSPASDLYSVGVVLFELMVGHRPFSGTPAQLMSAHLNQPVHLPDSIPDIWRSFVLTSLQKLAGRRFRSAAEMLAALRSIAKQTGIRANAPIAAQPPPSLIDLPFRPIKFEQSEPLHQRVSCLAAVQPSEVKQNSAPLTLICRAEGSQIIKTFRSFPKAAVGTEDRLSPEVKISLLTPIQELLSRPQGCFAVAQDAVYLVSPLGQQRVVELEPSCKVAVEEQGRWLAIVSSQSTEAASLTFKPLLNSRRSVVVTQPIQLATRETLRLLQLVALDSRHIVVILASDPVTSFGKRVLSNCSTRLEIFTRRGNWVGTLRLPVGIGKAISTFTPYRLLATDQHHSQAVLLIDLKPFRILRITVAIEPEFLTASPWGYSVTDRQGRMVFLDYGGEYLGQINAFVCPTAIAPVQPYGFLIAAWKDNDCGCLHSLDLRNQDIDFLI